MERNAEQLAAHDGPYFDHWRIRCAAAFGVILAAGHEHDGRHAGYDPGHGD